MWAKADIPILRLVLGGAAAGCTFFVSALTLPQSGALAATQVVSQAGKKAPTIVELMGQPITADAAAPAAANRLAESFLRGPFTLQFEGHSVQTSRADWGAAVDRRHLSRLIAEGHEPSSAMRRLHDKRSQNAALSLPIPTTLDEALATPLIKQLKDMVDRAPTNARAQPRARTVLAAKAGVEVNVVATLAGVARAIRLGRDSAQAVVRPLRPDRTGEAYADLDMSAELATFSTPYNRSNAAADRTHNLKITAQKIDGLVIAPGSIFDFNKEVGPRTRTNGYRNATVIAGGQLVDGMGGGTCQIASTLHAAALFSGLPIVTRSPHSRPSYYIKLGLDATVAYGSLNFRFRNDLDFPLVIDATVEHGQARVALRGARKSRRVTFVREIKKAVPFAERQVIDDVLPTGLRILSQRGVPGFEVYRKRTVEDVDSGEKREEEDTDIYPPTTQRWVYGKGPEAEPGFRAPDNDGHPEYVADEFLTAVAVPDSNTIKVRAKQGRFGTYGWTMREGMVPTPRN